ncbi:alpha/beta hydrolase fold domain-containing protein [Paraburkholderia nodosa]|uniref:alpha/beta hydrolase fold domain-containing protein n=1 Tax=Paraburkholderia nodosa TaxID=392320 RepID=UPI002480692E|nr:alpha/beta hydrolase fold domain-containing protein [Paraburkholderia nodosa]
MPASRPGCPCVRPSACCPAEFDPLRDDGNVYAERLHAAGAAAQFHLGRGLLHGCMRVLQSCPETARLIAHFLGPLEP